jgi:hypothetical protein
VRADFPCLGPGSNGPAPCGRESGKSSSRAVERARFTLPPHALAIPRFLEDRTAASRSGSDPGRIACAPWRDRESPGDTQPLPQPMGHGTIAPGFPEPRFMVHRSDDLARGPTSWTTLRAAASISPRGTCRLWSSRERHSQRLSRLRIAWGGPLLGSPPSATTSLGRQEDGDLEQAWIRHHDKYASQNEACQVHCHE